MKAKKRMSMIIGYSMKKSYSHYTEKNKYHREFEEK